MYSSALFMVNNSILIQHITADDTVIFATSEENLVSVLNTFYSYFCQWKLNIYYDNTKVIVVCDKMKRKRDINKHEYS